MFEQVKTINKNIIFLYASMLLSLVFGIIGSILITNNLEPNEFGKLSFLRLIVGFIQLLSSLGLYHTISRLIALNNDNKYIKSLLWGYNFKVSFIIGLVIIAVLVFYSFINNYIFENELGRLILLLSPLGLLIPLKNMMEISFDGDNNKKLLIASRLFPKLIFLLVIFIFIKFGALSAGTIYVLELCSYAFVLAFLVNRIGVRLKKSTKMVHNIKTNWKDYGLKIYYSILLASITAYLMNFYIPFFLNEKILGFFMLATALTFPLTMLPLVISSVYFEKFAIEQRIDSKTIKLTFIFSILILIIYNILASIFFPIFYSVEYLPVLNIIYYLSIQSTLHGLGDFFNKFLCSCGAGREALNGSYFMAVLNLSSFAFIYYLGLEGAIISKLLGSLGYMVLMIIFYSKFVRQNKLV